MSRPVNAAAVTRRALVKNLGLAAACAALPFQASRASEPQRLGIKDPAAVALGYVDNADQVDAKKYPAYVKGSTCENCLLLQGSGGESYRPCSLFPGKVVSAAGWCSGWTAEI